MCKVCRCRRYRYAKCGDMVMAKGFAQREKWLSKRLLTKKFSKDSGLIEEFYTRFVSITLYWSSGYMS